MTKKMTKAQTKAQQEIITKRIALIRRMRDYYVRQDEMGALAAADMHYTDAPQYAAKHYGETFRETTRHDNDWN